MKRKLRDWKTWFTTLWGGAVSGFASSGLTWLGLVGVDKMGVQDIPAMNWKAFVVMCAVGALSHGFMFLQKSPVAEEIEVDDGLPPSGSLRGTISKVGALAVGLSLFGCATFKTDLAHNSQRIKVAAYLGTFEALRAKPEWKPQFELVAINLKTIENSDAIDFVTVISVLQTLPIKELKGERTVVYITAAAMLLDDVKLQIKNTDEARTVVRALREGIELGAK